MEPSGRNIIPILIQDEMRNSYMDYSMSVIIGRALPDVRDGLKPVHRRILYAMYREGLLASKRYTKCAGVVGEVLKKYHPHGDGAVYDALVRMAQPWNLRYLLVDGQGNFGSVDGDPAAAYRYTESRMTKLAEEMLADIDRDTVDFQVNFDGTTEEPRVLPSRFPNLLVNGADGIAVGMATKIPPHNLREIIAGCVALIEDPEIGVDELMELIPGPDFPTAATIYGRQGVRDAYTTGRGRVVVRGKAEFEEIRDGREAIIITELPYQVNKARLVENIADLVRDKRIEGISALRDESDRQGMRVVIELKRDAYGEVVLNLLYKHTPLQNTYGVILLAIVNQQPRILTLKEMLSHYVSHQREVVLRRTHFELAKAQARAHLLEGYLRALDHLDAIIALIRASQTVTEAREGLMSRFEFSELQATAILEMRLQRLTAMERQKIEEEHHALMERIQELEAILGSEHLLMRVVREELESMDEAYGDERRTKIVDAMGELSIHDLVPKEDQVVTVSRLGYIKRCKQDEWRMQHRGGVGKKGMNTRDEDVVTSLFIANTHSLLLVFTRVGKVYPLEVYKVPELGRNAKGRPIINLVAIPKDEQIAAVVSVPELEQDEEEAMMNLLFVSRQGLVKRTPLSAYKNLRKGGMIACGVADEDELVVVRKLASLDGDVMLMSQKGKCIRFDLEQTPTFGRSARGNRGIALADGDRVVDALVVPSSFVSDDEPETEDEELESAELEGDELEEDVIEEAWETTLLTVTQLGFGKRTPFERYRRQGRYGKGIISTKISSVTGDVVGALEVSREDQMMLVTDTGRVIRIAAASVRLVKSRASKGVRLMRLEKNERIVDMARIEDSEEASEEETQLEEGVEVEDNQST